MQLPKPVQSESGTMEHWGDLQTSASAARLNVTAGPSGRHEAARINRRLAAVAFADIVGYTILMANDESRTHRRWMKILSDVIRPRAKEYRGTVVKSTCHT